MFDMSAAAKALAWAQLWDGNDVLTVVKLQVHTAVGMELQDPCRAGARAALEAKLLPASLAYLEILEAEMSERVADAPRRLGARAVGPAPDGVSDAGAIRDQARHGGPHRQLRDRMFTLEDEQIDARSAYRRPSSARSAGASAGTTASTASRVQQRQQQQQQQQQQQPPRPPNRPP